MSDSSPIARRKSEHLDLCRNKQVEFKANGPWFDCVQLVHQALPSFPADKADMSCQFLGRKLSMPFIIGAMTGGTAEADALNLQLAELAARYRIGFATGSQRPMLEAGASRNAKLRSIAPDILILGNIGLPQAMTHAPDRIAKLADQIGADGICLHLNAAMELFQQGGDTLDGDPDTCIRKLAKLFKERLIVKETGCGISRGTAERLITLGVRTIDVAGAGGTSWVRVENLRRPRDARGPEEFEEWGIPTAASLLEMQGLNVKVISSGGLRSGLDVAKSLVLGADLASSALPILRALNEGGMKGAGKWIENVETGLRAAMLLVGARNISALQKAPSVLSGPLLEWRNQRGIARRTR